MTDIDWNKKWEKDMLEASVRRYDTDIAGCWNKRAKGYMDALCFEEPTIEKILSMIIHAASDTILDIGCGPGTLTIPLAKTSRSVTALDAADQMLDFLQERAKAERITNIASVNALWEDAVVIPHDIVVAYQCLIMPDMHSALEKMDSLAKKHVYLFRFANRRTHLRNLWELLCNEPYRSNPDYIYIVNILHQMGIFADVKIFDHTSVAVYDSVGQAILSVKSNLGPLAEGQDSYAIIGKYLEKHLEKDPVTGKLLLPSTNKMAMIDWTKAI